MSIIWFRFSSLTWIMWRRWRELSYYDSADNRWLCLRQGIRPVIRHKGVDHGSGLGAVRSIVENANTWILNNKRLDRRHDRSAGVIQSLLTTACNFVIANRLADL
jgi:hypothetical protein